MGANVLMYRCADLALALSQRILTLGIHVLFILAILAITIVFCHSLIRLFMLAIRFLPRSKRNNDRGRNAADFAPEQPIRVHLARDEEIAIGGTGGIEDAQSGRSEMTEKETSVLPRAPPPAYGLWRSSVVSTVTPASGV